MKQFFKIVMVCLSVLLIVSASCSVAFAVDEDSLLQFSVPSDKPTVTGNSGYIEMLFEDKYSGWRYVHVYSWFFSPTVDSSSDYYNYSEVIKPSLTLSSDGVAFVFDLPDNITGNLCLTSVDSEGWYQLASYDIPDGGTISFDFFPSGRALVGHHCYGALEYINYKSYANPLNFVVNYSSDAVITHQLNGLLATLKSLSSSIDSNNTQLQTKLDSIIIAFSSLDSSLDSFHDDYISKMTELFLYLDDYLDYFETLIENTDEVEPFLSIMVDYLANIQMYCEEIWYMTVYINEELISINSKLQQIIDLLKVEPPSTTKYDNSDLDNYYDAENGLLQNSDVDVGSAVQVEINQNALTVIWDFVERALNSHGKVFGMVLTILSLGIIALILGR